jgi:hypothetical protein
VETLCPTLVSVGLPSRYKTINAAGSSSVPSISNDESGTLILPERSILKTLPSAVPPDASHETLSPTDTALLNTIFFLQQQPR